ncbi:hypothetical protein, partial [Dysgonomonas sp. 511]|uniref:hypothetical protein n=1 Tax=Dysgonomonas sp. 511 TaxID=2302930 RepID=UPI0013D8C20E
GSIKLSTCVLFFSHQLSDSGKYETLTYLQYVSPLIITGMEILPLSARVDVLAATEYTGCPRYQNQLP